MLLYPEPKVCEFPITYELISDVTVEVVTLADAKAFLQIDFPDFDTLISLLITAAREEAEKLTGLSIGEREIQLTGDFTDEGGYMPFEPIVSDTDGLQIVGYTPETCPAAIKLAIMKSVHSQFENRQSEISMDAQLLKPFRRRVGL